MSDDELAAAEQAAADAYVASGGGDANLELYKEWLDLAIEVVKRAPSREVA